MDEAVQRYIANKLEEARKRFIQAEKAEEYLRDTISLFCEDEDLSKIPTKAENADNLEEAINRFLQYGEYNISGIVEELAGIK